MRRHQLKELINSGESTTVEFKRKFTSPEKIAKELTAFANTKGGYLLLGVDDDKKIIGVESEKEDIARVEHACGFFCDPPLEPSISIVPVDYKDIIVVYISESDAKPHKVLDPSAPDEIKVYIRQGEESVAASREMIRILRSQRSDSTPLTLSIGDKERRLFEFLEKNRRATVRDFAYLVNISDRRAARLLVRLVRAGVLNIHTDEHHDYYTLVEKPA
jgi:predicted HTH transcriptional regulator